MLIIIETNDKAIGADARAAVWIAQLREVLRQTMVQWAEQPKIIDVHLFQRLSGVVGFVPRPDARVHHVSQNARCQHPYNEPALRWACNNRDLKALTWSSAAHGGERVLAIVCADHVDDTVRAILGRLDITVSVVERRGAPPAATAPAPTPPPPPPPPRGPDPDEFPNGDIFGGQAMGDY